jgi:hypothetical protein
MSKTVSMYPEVPDSIVHELARGTAESLSFKQDELSCITYQVYESNVDGEYSKLACECCIEYWGMLIQEYPQYADINIACEAPDIKITFSCPQGRKQENKIELKSSKSKIMNGSTIAGLNINQSLIYCLRPGKDNKSGRFLFKSTLYHTSMKQSEIDLFQDRSPRPGLDFDKMPELHMISHFEKKEEEGHWIIRYARCALNRIRDGVICAHSWQDDMVREIKRIIIYEFIRDTSQEEFRKYKMNFQDEDTNN